VVSTSQRKIFKEQLEHLYLEKHWTDEEVASELNCAKQSVYVARKKFGISAVTPRERNSKLIKITDRQEQILRGSLLGDAYVDPSGVFTIEHGKNQLDYLNWLYRNLAPYFNEIKPHRTGARTRSCSHDFGVLLRKEHYPEGKKRVTKEMLNKLTPLSIAVWFMDDGQLFSKGNQSRLSTCGFTKEENELIVDYLKDAWDVVGSVREYGGYNQIYFNKEDTRKLLLIIRPHVPMCMRRKVWKCLGFSAYLSGGMEYKKNLGAGWRTWLTERLHEMGHDAIDPVKLEAPDEGGIPVQSKLTELKRNGNLDEVRKIVRHSLFRKDMFGIQVADAIVVYYDESVQRGAGTLSEAWEAFREGRPVYLVTDFPVEKIPTWLIGETTAIFPDFDAFLEYLKDENKILADVIEARKTRDEVLSGIY
jgi:hypothetical protein